MLKSSLSYFNDAYILVKGDITVIKVHSIQVSFKYCQPCTKCITKLDITTIDDPEYLDLLLSMYNLMEYRIIKKKQEVYGVIQKMKQLILIIILGILVLLFFCKHKAKLLGNRVAQANEILENATVAALVKYFWRLLKLHWLITLKLRLIKPSVLSVLGNEEIMLMLILIILFLLSKTQSYMVLS